MHFREGDMAQDFSTAFYKSAEWLHFREWVIADRLGLCERCGQPGKILHHKILLTPYNIRDPRVTMNPDNVEYLCKECHEAAHHAGFDADGRPVPENYWRG